MDKQSLHQQFKLDTITMAGSFLSVWCGISLRNDNTPEYREGSLKT